MASVSQLFIHYGYALLFVWVLLEQLGLPAPTAPLLLAAGTLGATRHFSLALCLLACVLACLIGDLFWFMLGRRYGGKVLRLLCRISFEASTCVSKTENYFARRGSATLLFAKFVPGLSTVAPPIAGQSGLSYSGFFLYDGIGSIIWAGAWLVAGRFFGDVIRRSQPVLVFIGHFAAGLVIALIVISFIYKVIQQRRFLSQVQKMRVDPQDVFSQIESARISGEAQPFIIDLRTDNDSTTDPRVLPGAVRLMLHELRHNVKNIPHDRDIIVYCTCPNEESAAKAALQLHKAGIHRVRPLRGGFDGWKQAGYPLEEYSGFSLN